MTPSVQQTVPLCVGRPNLCEREVFDRLVDGIFERRWLTNSGPLVNQLEAQLCDFLGVEHCIPLANATLELQVASAALGLSGEVIMPAFTFVATPHSVRWQGLVPVFCEIDPETHLLDVAAVEQLVNGRTSAILGVHAWGRACHPEELAELAQRHGLELYFDAAHAFGCGHAGKMVGGFGRCEVFSFHATKVFNTFEGGAIATNDAALAARIRLMINFGFSGLDTVTELGINAKMSEIHAAMGIACFARLDAIVATNERHFSHYRRELAGMAGIRFFDFAEAAQSNWQYVVIEVDAAHAGFDRDELMEALHAEEVIARRYFFPGCHRMEPYASEQRVRLPVTEALCERVLVLPTGTGMTDADVARVCALIRGFAGARPSAVRVPAAEI